MIDKIQNKLKERLQYHKGIADDLEKNPEFQTRTERLWKVLKMMKIYLNI